MSAAPACLFSAISMSAPPFNAFSQKETMPSGFQVQLASSHLFPIVVFDCATLVGRLGRGFNAVPPLPTPVRCTRYRVFATTG